MTVLIVRARAVEAQLILIMPDAGNSALNGHCSWVIERNLALQFELFAFRAEWDELLVLGRTWRALLLVQSCLVDYSLVKGFAAGSKAESLITLAMIGKCGSGIVWLEDGWNVIRVGRGIVVCKESFISLDKIVLLLTPLQFYVISGEPFTNAKAAGLLVSRRG